MIYVLAYMTTALAIFLSFLVAACSGECNAENTHATSQHVASCSWAVIADERFSVQERILIDKAFETWNSYVPEMSYTLLYRKVEDKYEIEPNIIHIHRGYLPDMDRESLGWTNWRFFNDSFYRKSITGGEIYINIDSYKVVSYSSAAVVFTLIVEHEAGHAFGLVHTDPKVTPLDIMNPSIGYKNRIMFDDVAEFYRLHNNCQ